MQNSAVHTGVDRQGSNAGASVPGPRPPFALGWRANAMRYFRNPIAFMSQLREKYGNVACLASGGNQPLFFRPGRSKTSTVFGFGAKCNREVLTQPNLFESDCLRGPTECEWLSDNLVSANREDRAFHRRLLAPAFARPHLKAYYVDLLDLTEKMMSRWEPGGTIDLVDEMETFSSSVASKCFYGQDPQQHHRSLAAVAQEIARGLFSPVTMIPLNFPGSPYRRFLRLTEEAGQAVLAEIEKRRSAGLEGSDSLSMMIKAHDSEDKRLSDTQLIGNTFALFLAGHKAPAGALIFTFYLLTQHPEAASDLLDELDHNLGGEPPSVEQIWKLPVLDCVVQESMRLLSPAVVLWRRLTSEASLGEYNLPAGCEVVLSPYITHIDPEIYTDPKKYLPGRWLDQRPSPFEYLPFSYGARKCLGAALGEMMLKLVVATVVQKYRFQVIPDTKIDIEATFSMKPKDGLPLVVHKQDREFQRSKGEVRGFIRHMVENE